MTWEEFLTFNKPEVFKEQLYTTEEIHLACLYYVERSNKNNTMTWEEFKEQEKQKNIPYGLEKTDIECPECGGYLYKNTLTVLCTYPPQYKYECIECGWHDTAP